MTQESWAEWLLTPVGSAAAAGVVVTCWSSGKVMVFGRVSWSWCCVLLVLTVVDANVADVWVCEHHKLALVAGVCHDLLIACSTYKPHEQT